MGLDTHMIAGSRACSTSTRPTNPTITNKTSPHYDEALPQYSPSSSLSEQRSNISAPVDNSQRYGFGQGKS
jgi:hypothetical protein